MLRQRSRAFERSLLGMRKAVPNCKLVPRAYDALLRPERNNNPGAPSVSQIGGATEDQRVHYLHLINTGVQILKLEKATPVGYRTESLFASQQAHLKGRAGWGIAAVNDLSADAPRQALTSFPRMQYS